MNTENTNLELILTFLGIQFIDYKGHRTSNGHKTAKTIGQIKAFFGKNVMTSGQFIEDINWWDFKNDWRDLMFLVEKIESLDHKVTIEQDVCRIERIIFDDIVFLEDKKEATYKACFEFIKWHNSLQNG